MMQGAISRSGWGESGVRGQSRVRGIKKVKNLSPLKIRVNKVGDFSSYEKHIAQNARVSQ